MILVCNIAVVEIVVVMGCGPSKVDDLPLVSFCKERKELIKSAGDHRFALAAAHLAYFRQLSDVGDSLCRFVEEELVLSAASSSSSPSSLSSLSSPVLTLPSDDLKKKSNAKGKEVDGPHLHLSSSSSLDSDHHHHHHHDHHHHGGGHLEISDEYDEDEDEEVVVEVKRGPAPAPQPSPVPAPQPGISYMPSPPHASTSSYPPYASNSYYSYYNDGNVNSQGYYPYPGDGNGYGGVNNVNVAPPYGYYSSSYYRQDGGDLYGGKPSTSYNAYYMKKSSTRIPSVIYEEPKQNPIYSFSNSPNYNTIPNGDHDNYTHNVGGGDYGNYTPTPPNVGAGYYGWGASSSSASTRQRNEQPQQEQKAPTPPSPKVPAWDFFNPFDTFENGAYSGFYQHGYRSDTSSPDSTEVREREGIPELEEETESEVSKEPYNGKRNMKESSIGNKNKIKSVQFEDLMRKSENFDEGTSKEVPMQRQPKPEPKLEPEYEPEVEEMKARKSSSIESEISTCTSSREMSVKKKGVSFDVGGSVNGNGSSGSHLDIDSSSRRSSLTTLPANGTRDLREVVREIKDEFVAATDYGKEVSVLLEVGKEPYKSKNTFLRDMLAKVCSASMSSYHTPSSLARGYPGDTEDGSDSRSLTSTLDKLYVWEKKLYKEIKDEERLRVMYEKECKKLKALDDEGAESTKIEATQAAIRKLLTKIDVSVRAVDSISSRIHKLRDEELHPRMKELIYGLRRMWKLMLKCHQKQFQAILESQTRALKANTGLRRDSSVRATIQLEAELIKWCHRFNNWITMQKSYADTLNHWLSKCLHNEPEITPDGEVPYSPGRVGAPPIFVICHDWKQAMERITGTEVQTAMNDFATSLHQLWERQDEEQRRRLKSETLYKDFEKQIRAIKMERQRKGGQEHDDTLSDKNSMSMVPSESGVSPLDDLKVDLDSMRQRVKEQRAGHKEAVKLVHDAVSRSIQSGLIPIFESLENFTSEASKAFDDVRLENESGSGSLPAR